MTIRELYSIDLDWCNHEVIITDTNDVENTNRYATFYSIPYALLDKQIHMFTRNQGRYTIFTE